MIHMDSSIYHELNRSHVIEYELYSVLNLIPTRLSEIFKSCLQLEGFDKQRWFFFSTDLNVKTRQLYSFLSRFHN